MILDCFAEEYEEQIWQLVKLTDHDFIPPLSARTSTTQGNLQSDEAMSAEGPVFYFEQLKKQEILIFLEGKQLIGFMSYIPQYVLEIPGTKDKREVNYVSTVIVHPNERGQHIAEKLYQELSKKSGLPIATRTWNRNSAHIHILEKLGFELVATLKNDRGENVDTVYYMKN